jgi:hypothetical protein
MKVLGTYVVAGLLILVTLLVLGSLGLVGTALLLVQGLPPLTENLTDLAYGKRVSNVMIERWRWRARDRALTEADAGVLLVDVLALLVGEEHVGRETSLGGIGVWEEG